MGRQKPPCISPKARRSPIHLGGKACSRRPDGPGRNPPARMSFSAAMDIAIPIFDNITALDAIGPYEVLSRLPDATVHFIASEPGPKRTENSMLALHADGALTDVPNPDVIVFPGGWGTRALTTDEPTLVWLRAAHET